MAASSLPSIGTAEAIYPITSEAAARYRYLGKELLDVQAPAVVIDVAVARRNCELMRKSVTDLKVGFRAHVKTHKTTQLAKLQVGDTEDIRLIVSTIAEAESLVPWLQQCTAAGKTANVLYGLPVAPSAIPRLAQIAQILGDNSIGLMVDHQDQIRMLEEAQWPHQSIPVFVKIDVGYHRAGIEVGKPQMADLVKVLSNTHKARLTGFYAHMGHSYGVGSPSEALQFFVDELTGLEHGATTFLNAMSGSVSKASQPLVLSLGASPTATSIQNLVHDQQDDVIQKCQAALDRIKSAFSVEIHAGVYPLLDMQQLATRARTKDLLSFSDLGLRVLVEVASVYNDRAKPEALIAAGSIALGREPCKSYPGWGVVSAWPHSGQVYDPEGSKTGWTVGSISQEHGILRWEGSQENFRPLAVGDKLLVWPNHACMAGPNYGFYLVVDGATAQPDRVVDIWTRCRGW